MADVPRRRLFGRRATGALAASVPVAAPTAAPNPKDPKDPKLTDESTPRVRPAGPRGERTVTVAVRLTPAEHARWVAAATAGGRGQMGRWVRETVTARLDGRAAAVPVSAEQGEQLAALRAELSRVGSNLNQVARALNVQAKGGPVQVDRDAAVRVIEATKVELGWVRDLLHGRAGS